MYTSDHARDRIQERCGINKASCDRIAKIAFDNGLTHAEATGQLKAYITKIFNRNESANNIRIYAEKIWIFANVELVNFKLPPGCFCIAQAKKKSCEKATDVPCITMICSHPKTKCVQQSLSYSNTVMKSFKIICAEITKLLRICHNNNR